MEPPELHPDPVGDRMLPARLTRLARVTSELGRADTVEAVTRTVVAHGRDAVDATMGIMTLLSEDRQTMRLAGLAGSDAANPETWRNYPATARTPSGEAIRTGRRVIAAGRDLLLERFPDMANFRGDSIVVLPLRVDTHTIGAVGLAFAEDRRLTQAELDFLDILADTCAQALGRIAAREAVAEQGAKLAFLADAATELASSLHYEATLNNVARLSVPAFADWCAIDVLEDGRLHRVAVAHVDPAKVRLAQEMMERYPPDPRAPIGAWSVIRSGVSELYPEITEEMLVLSAQGDEERLRLTLDLDLRSVMIVPLVARDRVLGVLTWVAAESGRRYTHDDLALAEDLAKRAAVSIDNAELHSQTLAAAVQLQRAVLPEAMPDLPEWAIAAHYSPAGRTEVGGDFYDAIALQDGRVALFIGDVMGRDVGAAAAMEQVRAAVRAYAAVDASPACELTRLDQMYEQYPTDQLVTLVYMLADPGRDELLVANAGHPPPVVLRADGSTEQLPLAEGAPLGVGFAERQERAVALRPGDAVLAFTDGLIERRDEDISDGQERLLRQVPTLAGEDLEGALKAVVAAVRDPLRDDDVAALVARRTR